MCILYFFCNDVASENAYKLILIFNRDEYYSRPTRPASFLEGSPNVLAGIDMEPGREGGTWLAVSKAGRIAALLNVLQSQKALATTGARNGRGFLVRDYVTSTTSRTEEYLTHLQSHSKEYNLFSMVAIEMAENELPRTFYYSNVNNENPHCLPNGAVHGFGNSFMDTPFKKVEDGRHQMSKIIKELNSTCERDKLISALMETMTSCNNYYPDEQMLRQAPDLSPKFLEGLSSRFVKLPNYGTRTHTIILVDTDNHVFFHEKTLITPVGAGDMKWKESTFEFAMFE